MRKVRWGILGAGGIIHRWIKGALQLPDQMEIVGIASRTQASAQAVADTYSIPVATTYQQLIDRDDIDIYYVAPPHTAHLELALQVLRRGKAVLVEKPAGINADQFQQMVDCARENHAFLMEAVWTRFFPAAASLQATIASGEIGRVQMIRSAFCFRDEHMDSRLFDPARAGGSLLDTGVYNLHFADMIMNQPPVSLTGLASMDTDENHLQVDEQAAYVAGYSDGALAVMTSAVRMEMPDTAYIYGTKGSIQVPVFWKPEGYTITVNDESRVVELPVSQKVDGVTDEGYQYELAHVNLCLRQRMKQSPVMTHEKSLQVLRQCDALRAQWGLKYPAE